MNAIRGSITANGNLTPGGSVVFQWADTLPESRTPVVGLLIEGASGVDPAWLPLNEAQIMTNAPINWNIPLIFPKGCATVALIFGPLSAYTSGAIARFVVG